MDTVRISEVLTEAAFDPSKWQKAMEFASCSTSAFGAALFPIKGRIPAVPISESMGESFEAYISEGWIQKDERYKAYTAERQRGVKTDFDFISFEGMKRHPYYQDFLGKYGLQWFAGVDMTYDTETWCLSLNRTVDQGPFLSAELERLAKLSKRLTGTVAVARSLGFAKIEAALSAFEASGSAVVMFNRLGLINRLNQSAERLLTHGGNLRSRKIVSYDSNATARMDQALKKLLWDPDPEASLPPVIIPRKDQRSLLVYLTRMPIFSMDIFADCRAIAIISDLGNNTEINPADLKAIFGLTSSESKIAIRLRKGENLENIAVELGISYETARSQLKSIFLKTDVKRQPELVSLLSRIKPPQSY